MSAESSAAAAGMLAGIIAGWKRDANPGALDDMIQGKPRYGEGWAATDLLFADGEAFVIACQRVDPAALKEALANV